MHWFRVLLFVALSVFPNPSRAEELRLRPFWPDPALDRVELSMSQRLAQIDSLEAAIDVAPADSSIVELIGLYRSSPLMKHRIYGLEWTESLTDTTRLREKILTYRRTFNPWDAAQRLEEWAEEAPSTATPLRWRAMQILRDGISDRAQLAEARELFSRARECEDTNSEDLLGLAATLVAMQNIAALRPVAEELVVSSPEAPGSWLLLALAREAAGMPSLAERAFETAFAKMDPPMQRLFETPGIRLVYEDASIFDDSLVDQLPPPPLRGWWVRLIECEVLFSNPDIGAHGWDSSPGRAYMLFGRPRVMRALMDPSQSDVLALPGFGAHADRITPQITFTGTTVGTWYWAWLVDLPSGSTLPLIFTQMTRFARWSPTVQTEMDILRPVRRIGPVGLERSIPEIVDRKITSVDLLCRGFRVREAEMRIEAWTAIQLGEAEGGFSVRMRIMDESDAMIDEVTRPLEKRRSRAELRHWLSAFPERAQGQVEGFTALVDPGSYVVTIEVLDESGAVCAARDQALAFDPTRFSHQNSLRLSDLMLCDAYAEGVSLRNIPSEMVRYARVVIPHPEPRLHPEQESLFVYYEVYDADADSLGRTQLGIEYELYGKRSYDPYVGGAGRIDGKLAVPVFRAAFDDDKTGKSERGVVIRGTRLDVGDLEPGSYVLVVRVGDRLSKRESFRTVEFTVNETRARDD
jgi:hypothetical protein